jgi:membrane protease YdiL (CAAX protease family)
MADTQIEQQPRTHTFIASARHTFGMIGILAAMMAGGVLLQARGASATSGGGAVAGHQGIVPLYLSLMVVEWALCYYVWVGVHKAGRQFRELIGGRWSSARDVLVDVAITAVFFIVWEGTAVVLDRVLGPNQAKSISSLLPQGLVESALWVLLSCSAGFCEEVVYRGYLQKQFLAFSGSAAFAVAAQAVVFGLSHSYQGAKQVVLITVLGGLYGALAQMRRSLRPGMISHAASDVMALFR